MSSCARIVLVSESRYERGTYPKIYSQWKSIIEVTCWLSTYIYIRKYTRKYRYHMAGLINL